jgi:thermitase
MGFASRLCKLGFACGLAGTLGLAALLGSSQPGSARTQIPQPAKHVPGEIVVKLKDSSRARVAAAIHAVEQRLGAHAVVHVRGLKTDNTMQVIRIFSDSGMSEALSALKAEPSVEIAEPNLLFHTFDDGAPLAVGLPNDPDFNKTWGIKNTGQTDAAGQAGKVGSDINIAPLWQEGFRGSRKVLVAVVDTGIDWDHPDLKDNLYTNPGEAGANAANGKDDDGNGFIDDVHGWNFAAATNNSRDDHNHGSHCSGTIGGVGNNGIGVAGINWEVSLLPVKFLDQNGGGSLDNAVEAINYATLMKVNIMSNSWGGGGYSETLKQAIAKAHDAGILFVAAAGNDGSSNDQTPSYPASYELDNVLAVAATDNRDQIAGFSNYGTRTVHVAAPGVKVYSTVKDGKYDTFSGTSMATPHVSGIAALLLSANPTWTYGQIKDRLMRTSDPVAGLKRKVASRGRVNAYNAFHDIVPVINEPDPSLWKSEPRVVESEHPYQNNQDVSFKVKRPGAKYIRIHFEKIEVEANYDKVFVQSPAGEVVDELTGTMSDYVSEYVTGDTAVIHLKADPTNTGFGFKVDKIQVIY